MIRILIVLALLCLFAVRAGAPIRLCRAFHVSPDGSDAWRGALSQPNEARTDGPFRTLERARDAVREYRKSGQATKSPPHVSVHGGTYFLDRPLELTHEDSNTAWSADPGEAVVISGGRLIEGFREVEVNGRKMLAADLPEVKEGKWYFTQLFVNNRRRPRTRLPKEGLYCVAELIDVTEQTPYYQGQNKFRFNEGEFKADWKNLGDVDVVSYQLWVESRLPIKSVDEATRTVHLGKTSTFRMTDDHTLTGGRYCIENVFEALDTPGQWYLDRPTGVLYYYPYEGEDTKNLRVIAPRLERLIHINGASDSRGSAHGIHFRNIRFAHTQHFLPPNRATLGQAANEVPGAILIENAGNCSLVNCEIAHVGGYAVEFGPGCAQCAIRESDIFDLGAGGVKIHAGSRETTVEDNEIGDGGKIYASAVGVWIGDSRSNKVRHNHIHNLYYTGISVGWVWGYGESKACANILENNYIHDIGQGLLSDMGGIYSLGIQPNTVIRGNLIHDVNSATYGGWGIYTDEGSTDILIENNIVYRTKTGGFHQHYGKNNIVRNNIFAFAKEHQLQRSREEEHNSFTFERNIVYYDEGVLLGNNWTNDKFEMDDNLYFDASGRPITFAGATFEEWKKRGHDAHSLIADPLFADAKNGKFTLAPDSPALKLGFGQEGKMVAGPRKAVGPK